MEKRLSELMDGEGIVNYPFIIQSVKDAVTVNNKPYITLVLSQKDEVIEGKIWDLDPGYDYNLLKTATFALVEAEVTSYQNKLQLKIIEIQAVDSSHVVIRENIDNLVHKTKMDVRAIFAEMMEDVDNWVDLELSVLVKEIIGNNKLDFQTYPAAMKMHHDFYGGLIQHTYEMWSMANAMPLDGVDVELLKAGILLHDIGKIQEFEVNDVFKAVDYSWRGKVLGHIVLGINMVMEAAKRLTIEEKRAESLMHMIASHHRELEYGSPVTPKFKEAYILCHLDEISAKSAMVDKATENLGAYEFSTRDFNKGVMADLFKI